MTEETAVREGLLEIARRTGLPLICTNNSHYIDAADAEAHDILLCLQTGSRRDDEKRLRFHGPQFYVASGEEMRRRFAAYGEAAANTLAVAARCDWKLELGQHHLPAYSPIPEGLDANSYLAELCERGLAERFGSDPSARGAGAAGDGAGRHPPDRLLRVLPHRLGPDPRRPLRRGGGGSRPGQRGRLAGRLRAPHHQRRPAPLRAHLRALPQPGAPGDARHRHRLRRPAPRPGHPVRDREVRAGPGRPDHHLRHHGGAGRDPRRRPRPRRPAPGRRPAGQAGPRLDRDHPGSRPDRGARPARALRR